MGGILRQERRMWLCREREWNEQTGREREIHKARLRKVDQCLYEVFNFSSVYKEQSMVNTNILHMQMFLSTSGDLGIVFVSH